MRKCIRTAAALLLALALAAGLFGCSIPAPIVSGGDKPHTTEPAATGSQTDTEDTQNMENAEDTGEQDWAGDRGDGPAFVGGAGNRSISRAL